MNIAVIGAGASGMAAALNAAWCGAVVTLYDHNPSVGKKISVTGSGRCNITNAGVTFEKYVCADSDWIRTLVDHFAVNDLIEMLAAIGILIEKTDDGWYYPLSYSAHSVIEAFASALKQAGVRILTSTHVESFNPSQGGFTVISSTDGEHPAESGFDRIIVSSGGKAYPTLGSRGELFPILGLLGHTIVPIRPALAPILADLGDLSSLQGMRLDAGTSLWHGSTCLANSHGNLIFTKWGLNGPAVMDISHPIEGRESEGLFISLDLLDGLREHFDLLLRRHRTTDMPLIIFLSAFFSPRISEVLLKRTNLDMRIPLNQLSDETLSCFFECLSAIRLPVKGVRGFEYCQLSTGGVPVVEVDPGTMESQRIEGLFLTGETLDVVGPCGGYNLHFAFGSGALAGKAAASAEGVL